MSNMQGQQIAEPEPAGKPAPVLRILHRGPRYVVRHLHCDDRPWAVVCFEYWKPEPTLEGEFSAEGFFRHRGLNAFGIMAAENDWFQDDEILQVLAAIRAATPGFRLIGYGGSMGGFAAINFAQDLNLASLAVVIPQFSLDASKAPYEQRWRQEASRIVFRHDKIDSIPQLRNGWIVFDPWCVDGQHVADIQRYHALGEVRVHLGGHGQMLMLQQADMYTQMLLDMLEETFDPVAFRRGWRVARRRSAAFWLGLAQALLRRGRCAAALRALAAARALPHPEPAWIDLTEAEALACVGQVPAARKLAARWVDDAGFGAVARGVLEKMPVAARPLWRRVAGRVRRMVVP